MRAIEPAASGTAPLEGFTCGYELFGAAASPAVLLLPTWPIIHGRSWKMQVPFLARYRRVIVFDAAGNGRGERSSDPRAYSYERVADQAAGLLDHLGVGQAEVIGFGRGCAYGVLLAARHPQRVTRLALIASGVAERWPAQPNLRFWEPGAGAAAGDPLSADEAQRWSEQYHIFLDWFFARILPEPHSRKALEDCLGWALETRPEVLLASTHSPALYPTLPAGEALERVRCPVLSLHGVDAYCDPYVAPAGQGERPGWSYVSLEGSGEAPHLRDPVRTNLALAEHLGLRPAQQTWARAQARRGRRALFVSSPIGLGHIQRDLAIARELRRLAPDVQIDWLAQPPVRGVLAAAGEHIHPLSQALSSEAAHWEQAAGEHSLHAFFAWRAMDEILCANFMVFLEAARATPYDLWIGDEAWEVDHFLHENPELKTAPYVFLTDFLGWLPIDERPGSREAQLCADANAEMLEQVARYGRVRDRAIYVGDYEDLPQERFGPGLPRIQEWARSYFQAPGYIAPFDPADYREASAVRARLGYAAGGPLIIATVGGTAVGQPLLQRTLEAWPHIRRAQPDAQLVLVAGPRIDPAGLREQAGVAVRPYISNLHEHLACADLGIVQGGLSTTMELALARRPFLFFPLPGHCEQVYHVAHRLRRYRAGRQMAYTTTGARELAATALAMLETDTSGYREHTPGAAMRVAAWIAELL